MDEKETNILIGCLIVVIIILLLLCCYSNDKQEDYCNGFPKSQLDGHYDVKPYKTQDYLLQKPYAAIMQKRNLPAYSLRDRLDRKNNYRAQYPAFGMRNFSAYTIDDTMPFINISSTFPHISSYSDYEGEQIIHLYFYYDNTQPSYYLYRKTYDRLKDEMKDNPHFMFKEINVNENSVDGSVQYLPLFRKYFNNIPSDWKGSPSDYPAVYNWLLMAF